jgi:hypothetical protein
MGMNQASAQEESSSQNEAVCNIEWRTTVCPAGKANKCWCNDLLFGDGSSLSDNEVCSGAEALELSQLQGRHNGHCSRLDKARDTHQPVCHSAYVMSVSAPATPRGFLASCNHVNASMSTAEHIIKVQSRSL